jgi:hypothetical protein
MDKNRFLYRGKPKSKSDFKFFRKAHPNNADSSFVYGNLLEDDQNRFFICASAITMINCTVNNGIVTMIEVLPETVG